MPSSQRFDRKVFAAEKLDFNQASTPISELISDASFPSNILGLLVDIGGYVGIVVELGGHSVRVRSVEGLTKSFNVHGLRRIYGPRPEPPPAEVVLPKSVESPPPPAPVLKVEPPSVDPDYTKPVRPIADVVKHSGYPQTALGEHVDIAGYVGVVVQIVNRSLKVRAQTETTRSYNADALRRLYGS